MRPAISEPWVIWRLKDGRRGHENQTAALLEALAEQVALQVQEFNHPKPLSLMTKRLRGLAPFDAQTPRPHLILAAGHRTHLSALALRLFTKAPIVLLMQPSLPLGWFDFCLIPEHDQPQSRPNLLVTQGTLNRMRPGVKVPNKAMILLGGPSRHQAWDGQRIGQQIHHLLAQEPEKDWTLASSARTPDAFLQRMEGLNLHLAPVHSVDTHWLPKEIAATAEVWVSSDSVNMVYEALSAGAAVGILGQDPQRTDRVAQGLANLIEKGWVRDFAQWQSGQPLQPLAEPLCEAERSALWLTQRLGL